MRNNSLGPEGGTQLLHQINYLWGRIDLTGETKSCFYSERHSVKIQKTNAETNNADDSYNSLIAGIKLNNNVNAQANTSYRIFAN